MSRIPFLLTSLRVALAPIVVALALLAPSRGALGCCLVAAFLSDVVDGIVARRLGLRQPARRRRGLPRGRRRSGGQAISTILPRWRSDVPSVIHALRLRGIEHA